MMLGAKDLSGGDAWHIGQTLYNWIKVNNFQNGG